MKQNDYELVSLARDGSEEAVNILYNKYKPIIIKKSEDAIKNANHHGIEINDIIQECYIAFDEAIRNFNQNEDATFYTFCMMCIERKITNYIRRITGKKNLILNEALTLDEVFGLALSNDVNIENRIVSMDEDMNKIAYLRSKLTMFERNVFDLKMKNYSFDEIAKKLDKNVKSIYNTFNRIKLKYKNL